MCIGILLHNGKMVHFRPRAHVGAMMNDKCHNLGHTLAPCDNKKLDSAMHTSWQLLLDVSGCCHHGGRCGVGHGAHGWLSICHGWLSICHGWLSILDELLRLGILDELLRLSILDELLRSSNGLDVLLRSSVGHWGRIGHWGSNHGVRWHDDRGSCEWHQSWEQWGNLDIWLCGSWGWRGSRLLLLGGPLLLLASTCGRGDAAQQHSSKQNPCNDRHVEA